MATGGGQLHARDPEREVGYVPVVLNRELSLLPEHQRDIVRGDVEMGFAPLTSAPEGCPAVGGGPWHGEKYPQQMLAAAVDGWLDGVRCRVIDPAAQVEMKQMCRCGSLVDHGAPRTRSMSTGSVHLSTFRVTPSRA